MQGDLNLINWNSCWQCEWGKRTWSSCKGFHPVSLKRKEGTWLRTSTKGSERDITQLTEEHTPAGYNEWLCNFSKPKILTKVTTKIAQWYTNNIFREVDCERAQEREKGVKIGDTFCKGHCMETIFHEHYSLATWTLSNACPQHIFQYYQRNWRTMTVKYLEAFSYETLGLN